MSFSVEVQDMFGNVMLPPNEVYWEPTIFDWSAVGGPKNAQIEARGQRGGLAVMLDWIGYRVLIRNKYGQAVWWGFISEVSLELGAYSFGMSLDNMYNAIAVAYTFLDEENALQRGTTEWAENASSIVRYGRKELLYSHSDLEGEDAANDLADSLLNDLGEPIHYIRAGGGEENTATIHCTGWWARTGWRYYEELRGKEAHESYFADQVLGVGLTTNNAVFVRKDRMVYPAMGEHGFKAGDKIVISGSGVNNGTKSIASATPVELFSYANTTISFEASDDVYDTARGFGDLEEGDTIQIRGSPKNSGIKQIDEMDLGIIHNGQSVDHLELTTEVVPEGAGATIVINRHGYFKTNEDLNDEGPGRTVTIQAYGNHIAQSFSLSHDSGSWAFHEIRVRIRKVGDPQDSVRAYYVTNNGTNPGVVIEQGDSIAGADISTEYGWESFGFTGFNSLVFGQTRWIVFNRSGPDDPENYYEFGVDDGASYPRGVLKLWDGSAWQPRPEDASLAFQILGRRDTGTQIKDMLQATELFSSVTTLTTGRMHPLFRDGDSTISDEVDLLMKRGDGAGIRLISNVTPERKAVVTIRPSKGTETLLVRGDGEVMDAQSEPLPPGVPMAGKWVRLEEPGLEAMPPERMIFFVEEATFNVESGTWKLHPENAPDPFDIGLQQG